MARSVWLLGDGPGTGLDALGAAIRGVGGVVDHLSDAAVRSWLAALSGTEQKALTVLPNLLVADATLAWAGDAALLRAVATSQPWCFLPLVLVSRKDDDELCLGTYAHGAAGWVVLPEDEEELRVATAAFARYWFTTTMLPAIDAGARL